jgi:hypothetical protein
LKVVLDGKEKLFVEASEPITTIPLLKIMNSTILNSYRYRFGAT